MRIDALIWITANTISFLVSARDLKTTMQAWRWARANVKGGEMKLVAKRNFRASLFRFALAASFVTAGLIAVIPGSNAAVVWFLIAGAVILTIDVLMEARYRGNMFRVASERAKEDTTTRSHKRRKEHDHG